MNKLLLIDGNNLFHRAYHAIPHLTNKEGEATNAVFGFSNMLIKAVDEVSPRFIACAFDTQAPTFRHIEFEKYKAQRVAPPPDLYPQLPKVKKVLDAYGIKYFEKEGFEADDLLATLAVKSLQTTDYRLQKKKKAVDSRQLTVVILSGDRDVLQLVDGNIKVQMPGWNQNETTLYGAREVKEKYGLEPHQMVDYKSLTGDPSDNVPGISGVGPKTASALLQKYHTLENLFKKLKEVPEPLKSKLELGKEIALAAKKLIELDRNVAIGIKLSELRFDPDWEKVRREFEELGFRSIAAKIPNGSQLTVDSSQKKKKKSVNREPKTDNKSNQLELI
ncbi:MAG TPA: 5'-3' exonuclease H3TH domain-containing protein [Patescibacteria group bacterium]|nr:5'-3' exonuclease H3TH domain-containing protein [Patescibacteria group bacterium]